MKKIFSILLALALVLSVGLVTGTPVQAAVSQPQVIVSPVLTGEVAEYTIVFDINSSLLSPGDSITVDFPDATTVPGTGSYSDGDITINGANVTGGDVSVVDVERKVTMLTPISIGAPATVTVVFTTGANITNPTTTGDYTLKVNTSGTYDTTPVVSAEYAIRDVPAVTAVNPSRGNAGGTMWVVITGTSFMGDEDNNDSDTTISFGVGANVLQTKYISDTEINVQIEVTETGTFPLDVTVTAETPAGTSTTNGSFKAYASGTKQVDRWQKYTPSDEIFTVNTLVFGATYTTNIGDAVSGAGTGHTLMAHSGIYEEDLLINVEGLNLMSVSGIDATTIKGVATNAVYPGPAHIDILSSGVKISGFTIASPNVAAGQYYGGVVPHAPNIEISNNTFVLSGAYCVAIQTLWSGWGGDISGLKVHGNTFGGTATIYQAIFINHDLGAGVATVSDNTMSGNVRRGVAVERSNVVISGNKMSSTLATGTVDGIIVLQGNPSPVIGSITIMDNTVSGFNNGIHLGQDWLGGLTLQNVVVKGNTVTANKVGILVSSSADGVVVNYNDIDGNTELGLENTDGANLNALYNWWGHAIGPNHDTLNPGGQLNAVTGNADFSPWLYKPLEQFAHDAPCLAGSVVLANEAEEIEPGSYAGGWNSFSTPFTLDASANTVSELLALTAESDLFILRAQCFDPATQQWVIVIINNSVYGADYQINPGEGLFIQVSSKGGLPILVATATTQPPMRNLVAGWNLIGLPSLEEQTVAHALSGVSYSMVLSPKPPNDVAWIVPPDIATTEKLLLGKAYWLAMAEPGILFGSTYTPVASYMTWDLNQ